MLTDKVQQKQHNESEVEFTEEIQSSDELNQSQVDHIRKVLGLFPEEQISQDYEIQVDEIYNNRAKDMRVVFIFITLTNLYYQVIYLFIKNQSYQQKVMTAIYWILSLLSIAIMVLSYWDLKYVRPAYFIFAFRNILRLYNFEENNINTVRLQVISNLICLYLQQIIMVNSRQTRGQRLGNYSLALFYSIAVQKIVNTFYFDTLANSLNSLFLLFLSLLIFYGFFRSLLSPIQDLFRMIKLNFEQQSEFKQILNNLEESIIIISQFKVEYINSKFIHQFYENLKEFEGNEQIIPNQTKWDKIKKCVRKMLRIEKKEPQIDQILNNQAIKLKFFKELNRLESTKQSLLSENPKIFSIQDLILFEERALQSMIFYYKDQEFLQIKMKKFDNKTMLQFIDISKSILYDWEKSSNQALEMINACVSHEMRNPLNSIIAQNIEKRHLYQEMEEKIKKMKEKKIAKEMKKIFKQLFNGMKVQESSASVLQFQVQDLLDYAQIKSGKFRKNINEFNIIDAVEEVMIIQQRKAEDNNIRLYASFDCKDPVISTDKQRVMQVLLCLQSNALKFTEQGEVHIQVRSREKLQISVIDTGVGISKENQEKLFKMFGFLKETQKMNKNGVGLGLVISKQIVERFGGTLTMKSKVGEGSTFTFTFDLETSQVLQIADDKKYISDSNTLAFKWRPQMPVLQEIEYVISELQSSSSIHHSKDQNQLVPELCRISSGSNIKQDLALDPFNIIKVRGFKKEDQPKNKILIVDDQGFNVDALMIILKYTMGLDSKKYCDYALSGKQALNLVVRDPEKYNLILMDLNMPEMDGNQTMTLIREHVYSKGLRQPIISAVTGHSEQFYIDQAIKAGMNQVISKPVNSEFLKPIVKKLGYPI